MDVRADAAWVTAPALVAWGARALSFPSRRAAEFARHLLDTHVYLSARGSYDWLIARPNGFAVGGEAFARAATG
ncbi:hypothetical protein J0H58_21470 [bacterium]|nr:hypothetical protein [bacterium]